ncbi:MAG: phosphotransferase [Pseudomonadales bacterium]|nr:phosphotransferase [Pseudomonadales bacterium]
MESRELLLQKWVSEQLGYDLAQLQTVSGDASFRRYFRAETGDADSAKTVIAVDSPPETENNPDFIRIARCLVNNGFNAPNILAVDEVRGFMLLSDLGDRLLLPELNARSVEQQYGIAMETLRALQSQLKPEALPLPLYDQARLMDEMALFSDWFVPRYLGYTLSGDQQGMMLKAYGKLAKSALSQPEVFVHRDYHARNIMLLEDNKQGLIDLQDAVWGPITYDLVSLLRDCYVRWPREQTLAWASDYFNQAQAAGLLDTTWTEAGFLQCFEWMGMQRHFKAVGIFSRLNYRDNKPVYLGDIPRTYSYLLEVSAAYEELADLHGVLKDLAILLMDKNPDAVELLKPWV